MSPQVKSRSEKAGLPPGALVHVGKRFHDTTKISVLDYDEESVTEREVRSIEECRPFKDSYSMTWIDIAGIHDVSVLEELGTIFELHPLILEDILNTDQRPKIEDNGDYIYVVLRSFNGASRIAEGTSEQISIVLGPRFVISLREREGKLLEPIQERIRSGKGRIRKLGADYLAHAIIDAVVDNFFIILERIGEDIETIEELLVSDPTNETLHKIQRLKKEMILLRKSVWPLREVISSLERSESTLIQDATHLYFKDIYDHTIQVIDSTETYREILSGMLDIYLSSISNRMNQVMKILTIIATIFMPLTFLAGIYGMNFEYMPELKWRFGYALVWFIFLTTAIVMIIYFRRKKWI